MKRERTLGRDLPTLRLRVVAMFAATAAVAAAAAWLGTDLVMAPEGSERTRLIAMFAAAAAAVFVIGVALMIATRRSISRRILAVGIAAPLVVALTTLGGAGSMFISTHDTQFVIILTALAAVLAVALVQFLVAPLLRDLERIRSAAEQIGDGDLSVRAELSRGDELGALGVAFDAMADRIETTTDERDRVEAERSFMLAALSHDARTPLTAMRAAVEALQDGLAPDPVRYLDSIEHDLTAIESIVENIFILGQLEADQLRPTIETLDLSERASAAVRAIEPLAARKGITLSVNAPESVPARGARVETGRVINNLLSNAIRHAPSSSTIHIGVSADPEPRLTVRDEGPGFDAAFVSRAFEPFTRADPDRNRADGGAGLGLAVVHGLVETQGGTVWAEHGPGGLVGFALPPVDRPQQELSL